MEKVRTRIKRPTSKTVWAILKEAALARDETYKRLDKQMGITDKQLGRLGNRFGEVIESMLEPNLKAKFRELGFVFDKVHHGTKLEDKENKIFTEIDFTLENGDKVMLVEVKSKPVIEDIRDHIERMEKVHAHAELHNDRRIFLGAIASITIGKSQMTFALKNGFYIIQPSGETFDITVPEKVREWGTGK